MTRFCSDITPHMRLFELIRQQDRGVPARAEQAPTPAQMRQFVEAATRSLERPAPARHLAPKRVAEQSIAALWPQFSASGHAQHTLTS